MASVITSKTVETNSPPAPKGKTIALRSPWRIAEKETQTPVEEGAAAAVTTTWYLEEGGGSDRTDDQSWRDADVEEDSQAALAAFVLAGDVSTPGV